MTYPLSIIKYLTQKFHISYKYLKVWEYQFKTEANLKLLCSDRNKKTKIFQLKSF